MEITILNIVPSMDYSTPSRPVEMLTVYYQAANGYKSQMTMRKDEFDKETIGEKLKAHCGPYCSAIGQKFT